jgi:predicted acyltransferase (DUF342 family)
MTLKTKIKMKLAVPLAMALAFGGVEANAGIILGTDLAKLTVFSNTYTSTGANSIVHGSMLGGDVTSTGANAIVYGDVTSVNATNIGGGTAAVAATSTSPIRPAVPYVPGNTATVIGDVISGGVLTVGGATGVGPTGPNINGSVISTGASTIGAYATVGGDMLSGGVATTGAQSLVTGNVLSTGAASTGANGDVGGNLSSGGLASLGAGSNVTGSLYGSTITYGSGSSAGTLAATGTSPDLSAVRTDVLTEAQQVTDAQTELFNMGMGSTLPATMVVDTTLAAGIYSAASFSTTAGKTLTLEGDGSDNLSWVFNITDILAFGGTTNIVMANVGANASVYWNSYNGYITSGDGANVVGTLMAKTYITVGANSTVSDIGTSCGAVYSATSYVSSGDSAVIGGTGCAATTSVPEPESFGMLLAALALFGFKKSRKS